MINGPRWRWKLDISIFLGFFRRLYSCAKSFMCRPISSKHVAILENRGKFTELFFQTFRYFNWAVNYAELQAALVVFIQLVFWNRFLVRICSFNMVPSTINIVFHFLPPIALPFFTYFEFTFQQKLASAFVVLLFFTPFSISSIGSLFFSWHGQKCQ